MGSCFSGDINWCAPSDPDGWHYRDITDENRDWYSFPLPVQRTKKMSDGMGQWSVSDYSGADLNNLFSHEIQNQRFGCPSVGSTCGPLRQNRFCNGLQGKTHCHIATGQCVTRDTAEKLGILLDGELYVTWGVDDLSESCQNVLSTSVGEVVQNDVEWEKVFGDGDKQIRRPTRAGWCSVGDTWAYPGSKSMGAMWPSNDAGAPIRWNIVRFNDTSSLDSNSPLFMGQAICPFGYQKLGDVFGNSRDEIYNLDKSQYCCVPWRAVTYRKTHETSTTEVAKLSANKNDYCLFTNPRFAGPVLRASYRCRAFRRGRAWVPVANQLMWIL